MKKIFLLSVVASFMLTACSVGDLFVDQVAVHNGLIQKMDAVLLAEENFYNEYWALVDDSDVTAFADAYEAFKVSVSDLDAYYADTKFAAAQQSYVDGYNDYYKEFITGYVDYSGEFVDKVVADGYTYDGMESYFEKLDSLTVDFVNIHTKLIDMININADTAASGMTY